MIYTFIRILVDVADDVRDGGGDDDGYGPCQWNTNIDNITSTYCIFLYFYFHVYIIIVNCCTLERIALNQINLTLIR